MVTRPDESKARYILITQCLQNDFFLNTHSRLCLPEAESARILLGNQKLDDSPAPDDASRVQQAAHAVRGRLPGANSSGRPPGFKLDPLGRREVEVGDIRRGPLGQFLQAALGPRMKGDADSPLPHLHVINIRDWHERTAFYDYERQQYGAHCEAGSFGAQYVAGLEKWLCPPAPGDKDPWDVNRYGPPGLVARPVDNIADPRATSEQPAAHDGDGLPTPPEPSGLHVVRYNDLLTFYHIHSDSVFDFKPTFYYVNGRPTLHPPRDEAHTYVRVSPLEYALDEAMRGEAPETLTYVLVIGVYTDIKVKVLLTGLRTRYTLENLAVSDVLTGAPSIDRHIGALDFIHRVLHQVEVIHSLSEGAYFLGVSQPDRDCITDEEALIQDSVRYQDYRTYNLDRQIVLAYVDQQTAEYEQQIYRRAEANYGLVRRVQQYVTGFGFLMLGIAAIFGIIAATTGKTNVYLLAGVTGGLTLAQIFQYFFYRPSNYLRLDLENLARTKIALESHSLRMALLRYHLTKIKYLNESAALKDITQPDGVTVEGVETSLRLQVETERETFEALLGHRFSENEPGKDALPIPPGAT